MPEDNQTEQKDLFESLLQRMAARYTTPIPDESLRVDGAEAQAIAAKYGTGALRFFDVREAPFVTHGLLYNGQSNAYCRLPAAVTDALDSNYITTLRFVTTGGRVRFVTDADALALRCFSRIRGQIPEASDLSVSGFSVYENGRFSGIFPPPPPRLLQGLSLAADRGFDGCVRLGKGTKEITLAFPLHGGVDRVYIGVPVGATVSAPAPYKIEKPVCFFGSSITQGGNVSRPGNNYPEHLSRWLGFDFINLGLAGNCKGQPEICDYIAGLSLSALVLEYDANAPDRAFLEQTHLPFYRRFREAQPDLPLLMLSRSCFEGSSDGKGRRVVVKATYDYGIAAGDKHLWFLDGETIFGSVDRDACTVDRWHSTDLGAYRMAEALKPYLTTMLA
ncbi:MAG: SGNH/GDSL hydrolase family protein [Clostridiales bacterium]|jgi:hypothetical protein|nr:SGNH/GDSL hydrolase family protein [Clostridiales bacterium]